ncbi:conserved hypothetical protein [Paecilomyces variotii No. 5]|uniref:Xylanolytic transcriptional activator regulatory domain-containing protein n=1 Tax=Byssochlamys spectabilis (strain No. 5 / NBRC 109023) TaxID=1356009 RepID=V5G1W4_BYSSN|nr:conserved hypothetical protein [Paecilomyces variotii No. 5]
MDGSVDSVRVLVLLALYSLFDPRGIQTWTIVGIITRQAMILSLARRETTFGASSISSVESLHRLYWSVYALDRMVAMSVGQHPGLPGENIDIPLPAVTVDEFASPHRSDISSMLQVSHHVIQLRRLESKILESVHLCDRTKVSSMGSSDRTAIRDNIQYEIDNWYSAGCLIARPDTRNVRIHDTMAWLNARYYQLLLTLYYPCHFNRRARPITNEKLLSFVGKYIHYDHVLLEQRQLPLNYITLCRLVPVSLVLIHCFVCSVDTIFPAKGEVQSCIAILRAFPDDWNYAHSLAQLMTDFALFVSSYESRTASGLVPSRTIPLTRPVSEPSLKSWLEALRKQVVTIGGHIMGRSNCFQYFDEWDEVAQSVLPESHHAPLDYLSDEPPSIQGLLNDQMNTEIEFGFL